MRYFALILMFLFSLQDRAIEISGNGSNMPQSSIAEAKFTRELQPAWVEPVAIPQQLETDKSPIVLLLGDTQFYWSETQAAFHHHALKVNEASTLSEVGQQTVDFNPEYQTLALNTLRIIRDGKVIDKRDSTKIRFLEREQDLENNVYDGVVTAVFLIDDLRVGDVLEVAYTITGSNPIFGGKVVENAGWESTIPIAKRRVSALYSEKREIKFQYIGGLKSEVKVSPKATQGNGFKKWVFERTNLKAVTIDEHTPQSFQPVTWLQFSEFKDWHEVAGWATELFNLPSPQSGDYTDLIENLRTKGDNKKILAEALRFVQSDIRYTSISIGTNSHRPYSPEVVMSRRYGDCKDKTALLVTILRDLGISAKPVLVSVSYRKGFADWLPSPKLFDHAIVRVDLDGLQYWLDPTALQNARNIETIGYLHGGKDVLVVDPSSIALYTIPQITAGPIEEKQVVTLHDFKSSAELESRTIYSSAMAEIVRMSLSRMTPDQIEKYYLDQIRNIYPGAKWQKKYEIIDDPDSNKLTVIRHFSVDDIAELEDHYWHIYRRADRILDFLEIPKTANRTSPYAIEYPINFTFSQTVNVPSVVTLQNQQEAGAVTDDYFRLRKNIRCRGSTAYVEYDLTSYVGEVPPNEVANYSSDVRRARALMNTSLMISDKFE